MVHVLLLAVAAVLCTVVTSQENPGSGCLTKNEFEKSDVCAEYKFSTEEYDKFKAVLDQELQENNVLQNEWNKAKVEDEKERAGLRDEAFRAVRVFSPASSRVYRDYVQQLKDHRSITAPGFKYKGLHYFLNVAFNELRDDWGERRRVIHAGVVETLSAQSGCVINATTQFPGFALAHTRLDRAEKVAGGEGTIYSVFTVLNADISSVTERRQDEDVLVSPCDSFRVIATLRRASDKGDMTFNVVKMVTTDESGSGSRITSLSVLTIVAAVYALIYTV